MFSTENMVPPPLRLWVYIAPCYSYNLDHILPSEYTKHVNANLPQEDLDILMRDETERRKTFVMNWPYRSGSLSGINMAEAGFYSLGKGDHVKCVFCKGILYNWSADNDPMLEHKQAFSFCDFAKGRPCSNKKYQSHLLLEEDIKQIRRIQPLSDADQRKQETSGVQDRIMLNINVVEFRHSSTRLETFSNWPSTATPSHLMSAAGFYSPGVVGIVICFSCRGGFKEWNRSFDPWEQHAKYFPKCMFLLEQKGQSYVDSIQWRFPSNQSRKRVAVDELISSYKLCCKRCGLWNISAVWHLGLPCGHFLFCGDCYPNETEATELECPSCATLLLATFQIFLN